MRKPMVAIVGRPNVGKSTLFNKIIKKRKAIVEDQPGVTRDRNYHETEWLDKSFIVVDTGGFDTTGEDDVLTVAKEQVQLAIEEADLVLFLMDGKEGVTPGDLEVVETLRKSQRPFLLTVNKIDNQKRIPLVNEFYSLGVEPIFPISAEHSLGLADLMDAIVRRLPEAGEEQKEEVQARVCIVGRPNVGKSSLVNRMVGYERMLVHDLPGTTRDSIDTRLSFRGKEYILIDTAGIRRKGRVSLRLEKYAVIMALKNIQLADVSILITDATDGITEQDAHIAGYIEEAGKGLIVAVNKWDAIGKDERTLGRYVEQIRLKLTFASYAPIITISALNGQRVEKLFPLIDQVAEHHRQRLSTNEVNRIIEEAVEKHHLPMYRGRPVKFYYASQVSVKPPHFVIFANYPQAVHFSYHRFLQNQFREAHDFTGTPIKLTFRKKR